MELKQTILFVLFILLGSSVTSHNPEGITEEGDKLYIMYVIRIFFIPPTREGRIMYIMYNRKFNLKS